MKKEKKSLTAKEAYKYVYSKEVSDPLDYETYRLVLEKFMNFAIDKIIYDGETLNFGHRLGHLKILKIDRIFKINKETGKVSNRQIDWKSTNKMWEETGVREGLVFFSDPWYVRWAWDRSGGKCRVVGSSVYSFAPTNNSSKRKKLGTKGLLSEALQNDPLLHLKYEYRKRNEV